MDLPVPSLLICESTARFTASEMTYIVSSGALNSTQPNLQLDSSVHILSMSIHNLQEFHKNVMAKAEVIQLVGDAITNFTEVQCLTPRYLSYKVLLLGSICVVRVISYCFSGLQTSLINHLSLLQ